ncbi:Hypothetical protein I5071_44340 [Sandaracinus amylolyticus]|nr:Hypothetical protein I5071_44340 [Sandaracinus amylolyticus]
MKDEAFRTHVEVHRRAITLHCYRMLGSLQDAEEVAQESLLRAWQALDDLRSSGATKAWLYKIATNACLDLLKSRRRRALPRELARPADPEHPFGAPTSEAVWIEPAPDALLEVPDDSAPRPDARLSMRESIGLAFVTALQILPPKQRAALLLVDVLGWTPRETAPLLETTEVSVNSLLQRARKNLETRREEASASMTPEEEALVQRFVTTWESRDLDAFTALIAEDAVLSMPPQPEWYAGIAAIRRFYERFLAADPRAYRLVPIAANGSPAVAKYARSSAGDHEPVAITVLSFREGRVSEITNFLLPRLFPLFGLPERIA